MLARAGRWAREQLAFLAVLVVAVAAFAALVIWPDHWRRGTGLLALAMLLAGLLRLVLPGTRVGMLVVRSRATDVVWFLLLGGVVLGADLRLHS